MACSFTNPPWSSMGLSITNAVAMPNAKQNLSKCLSAILASTYLLVSRALEIRYYVGVYKRFLSDIFDVGWMPTLTLLPPVLIATLWDLGSDSLAKGAIFLPCTTVRGYHVLLI